MWLSCQTETLCPVFCIVTYHAENAMLPEVFTLLGVRHWQAAWHGFGHSEPASGHRGVG